MNAIKVFSCRGMDNLAWTGPGLVFGHRRPTESQPSSTKYQNKNTAIIRKTITVIDIIFTNVYNLNSCLIVICNFLERFFESQLLSTKYQII